MYYFDLDDTALHADLVEHDFSDYDYVKQ